MQTRIYVVINRTTGEKRLIEATSQAQAIRHCTYPAYEATVATAKTVGECVSGGMRIEKANEQQTAQT